MDALFPESGEIGGWVRDGELYVATDEASLAGFINGAAPFYVEHGAVEVGFQDYVKEGVYLTLELYRMKDEALLTLSPHIYMSMLETAEVVSRRYGISRDRQDEYALQSQQRTAAAQTRFQDSSEGFAAPGAVTVTGGAATA